MAEPAVVITDVRNCARCGQDHDDLLFARFTRSVQMTDGQYEFWAMCPVEHEPIIMHLVNDTKAMDQHG